MADVRQRRKATSGNGLPAGVNDDDLIAADPLPTRTVKIDMSKGMVGITCSSELEPKGVRLEYCDPNDLAAAAGLREGDVVVRCNGVPVSDHSALVNTFAAASVRRATVTLDYVPAASVASVAASMRAKRPTQKSLFFAYFLWLIAPYSGLHLFYLGRDAHALLHALTFGMCGAGAFRDLFCLPRYVSAANEEPHYQEALRQTRSARPQSPRCGVARLIAMFAFSVLFSQVAACAAAHHHRPLSFVARPDFFPTPDSRVAHILARSLSLQLLAATGRRGSMARAGDPLPRSRPPSYRCRCSRLPRRHLSTHGH